MLKTIKNLFDKEKITLYNLFISNKKKFNIKFYDHLHNDIINKYTSYTNSKNLNKIITQFLAKNGVIKYVK